MKAPDGDTSAVRRAATRVDYLRAVTLSKRVQAEGTIALSPYDPRWPSRYTLLAGPIRCAQGGKLLQLEHVGSTSVPGLAAKPVIHVVLAVADSAVEAAYVPAWEAGGFRLRIREPRWFEHWLLKATDVLRRILARAPMPGCRDGGAESK